jgi:hypothetical protein
VVTGPSNDLSICIAAGLQRGDQISLNTPANAENIPFAYLEAAAKQTAAAKMDTELAERMKIQNERAKTVKADGISQDQDEGGTVIYF